MLNNKVLLVVNSVYQLFTAVHMKRSILAKKEAERRQKGTRSTKAFRTPPIPCAGC